MGTQILSMIDTLLDKRTGVLKPPRFAATCQLQKPGGTATFQNPPQVQTYYAVAAPAESRLALASLRMRWTFSDDSFLARNEIDKWLWDRRARQIQKYPQDRGKMMTELIKRHIEEKLVTRADSSWDERVENIIPSMEPNEEALQNNEISAGIAPDSVAAGDQTWDVDVDIQMSCVTLASAPSITSSPRHQETAGISARDSKTVASGIVSVCHLSCLHSRCVYQKRNLLSSHYPVI